MDQERGEPGNDRPVNLTAVQSKLMESVIKDRIKHAEEQALWTHI